MESSLGDLCAAAVMDQPSISLHFMKSVMVLLGFWSCTVFVLADRLSLAVPVEDLPPVSLAPQGLRRHPDNTRPIPCRRLS
jgi:hypothetical protein